MYMYIYIYIIIYLRTRSEIEMVDDTGIPDTKGSQCICIYIYYNIKGFKLCLYYQIRYGLA